MTEERAMELIREGKWISKGRPYFVDLTCNHLTSIKKNLYKVNMSTLFCKDNRDEVVSIIEDVLDAKVLPEWQKELDRRAKVASDAKEVLKEKGRPATHEEMMAKFMKDKEVTVLPDSNYNEDVVEYRSSKRSRGQEILLKVEKCLSSDINLSNMCKSIKPRDKYNLIGKVYKDVLIVEIDYKLIGSAMYEVAVLKDGTYHKVYQMNRLLDEIKNQDVPIVATAFNKADANRDCELFTVVIGKGKDRFDQSLVDRAIKSKLDDYEFDHDLVLVRDDLDFTVNGKKIVLS